MPEQQDFATTGTESYKIPGHGAATEHVVLNIKEEAVPSKGILLEQQKAGKIITTGNIFLDIYNKINYFFVSHSKVKIKDKATFFHLLSVMINAGIPMVKALRSLIDQMEKVPRLQMIIEKIANDIEAGASLSESLFGIPDVFMEQEVGMVQSGEASGQLSKVLDNLSTDTEKVYTIKKKIKSAMMYPIVIFVLLIGVVVAMMVFVVPKLKGLFENAGSELPLITRIVVGISDFMVAYKLFFAIGLLIFILGFLLFRKTDVGRYAIDKFKIKMPLFGGLFAKSYLSRVARSLSNLLDSNISIVKAVEITGNSVGNEVYKRRLMMAMEDIKQGIPLAETISDSDLFPPMFVNMVDVGERTAQIDTITEKLAKFYEDEVDTSISGISKIIEPVILIVIGVTVGAVIAAVMMPIMQLSNVSEML